MWVWVCVCECVEVGRREAGVMNTIMSKGRGPQPSTIVHDDPTMYATTHKNCVVV